jgi:hypothetical protein
MIRQRELGEFLRVEESVPKTFEGIPVLKQSEIMVLWL